MSNKLSKLFNAAFSDFFDVFIVVLLFVLFDDFVLMFLFDSGFNAFLVCVVIFLFCVFSSMSSSSSHKFFLFDGFVFVYLGAKYAILASDNLS